VAGQSNSTSGSSNGYLYNPCGLAISNDSILYIADVLNDRVVMVNLIASNAFSSFGSNGSSMTQFSKPNDVFIIDPFVYVLDTYNYRIQKWLRNGPNPSTVPGAGAGVFNGSDYMFIDRYGNPCLSAGKNNEVGCFAPNSSVPVIVAGNGQAGSQSNQLDTPYGIYIDDNLTLYIADFKNKRIQMWKHGAKNGTTVADTGQSGSNLTHLYHPTAILVDTNGYMYIADGLNSRIFRWPPNSTSGTCIVACFGASGNDSYHLNWPTSLVFDQNGSLYVADVFNNRVQKFQIINSQSKNFISLRLSEVFILNFHR
jgi:hypothetical protein